MNIASVRRPIVPPTPPRAPDDMSFLGRLAVIKRNMIATWGQRAYEEELQRMLDEAAALPEPRVRSL